MVYFTTMGRTELPCRVRAVERMWRRWWALRSEEVVEKENAVVEAYLAVVIAVSRVGTRRGFAAAAREELRFVKSR